MGMVLTGDLGFRRGRAQEVDGFGVPEVLGNRGGVDSVQGVQEMMMARQRARKFPAATAACDWSSWRVGVVVSTDEIIGSCGKEGMHTYQRLEGDDASSMAKSEGSRWSEDSTIARRSFVGCSGAHWSRWTLRSCRHASTRRCLGGSPGSRDSRGGG
jgi:hypothetical protein